MSKTIKPDWYFIIPASLIFFLALAVTFWDFFEVERTAYYVSPVKIIGFALRKLFSYGLRISAEHRLIENGIYGYIRHPAYLGSLILSPGIPLIFQSLYGFLIMLWVVPCFLYRIKIEEDMLIATFGAEYQDYMKKSKKLIPYVY